MRHVIPIISPLSYVAILKPIWTYGIQLWGMASTSNIDILEHFQSKVLRQISNAPWYVPNSVIRKDLKILTVKEEISHSGSCYFARIRNHLNDLIAPLNAPSNHRRLQRLWPHDLLTRF
jgi:hypothetical protein